MNMRLAFKLLNHLSSLGLDNFVICAGARNAPLIECLNKKKIWTHFHENSASFFTLGLCKKTKQPSALITTSGTASAQCLPAVIEAHYSGLPLVIITADRPKSYRGSGAPQSIEQKNLFSSFVSQSFDIDQINDIYKIKHLQSDSPIHINICFDEPLIDEPLKMNLKSCYKKQKKLTKSHFVKEISQNTWARFLKISPNPLILVSNLDFDHQKQVTQFLNKMPFVFYLESSSNLRHLKKLDSKLIKSGSQIISSFIDSKLITGIVRIGGVPSCRLWRDLEQKYFFLPTLSFSHLNFSGLSRKQFAFGSLCSLEKLLPPLVSPDKSLVLDYDQIQYQKLTKNLSVHPTSEASLIYQLTKKIPSDSKVFLGNSLPIREWDAYTVWPPPQVEIAVNRGANGIDGIVSTFLGWSSPKKQNWLICGDLSTLYDNAGFWILPQLSQQTLNVIVVNNFGGKIFSQFLNKPQYINPHQYSFKNLSKMWNLNYHQWKAIPSSRTLKALSGHNLIELIPSESQ